MGPRRSISQNFSKTSDEILTEMEEEDNAESMPQLSKKMRDWQRALSEELKYVDERQDQTYENLKEIEERVKAHDTLLMKEETMMNALKLLEEKFNRCFEEMKKENSQLKSEMLSLKLENETLKNDVQLSQEALLEFKTRVQENIKEIEKHAEEEYNKLKETTLTHTTIDQSNKLKLNLPKYKGFDYERPIKFLSELKNYISIINPKFDEMLYIISQSLEESAQEWWYLIESEINNFEEFENKFKTQFWNKAKQKRITFKLEYGKYEENGKKSRVNYAIYLLGLANDLKIRDDERELVLKISDHFSREIKQAIQGQPQLNKETLFRILGDFDAENTQRSYKINAHSTPNRNFNRSTHQNYQTNNINMIRRGSPRKESVLKEKLKEFEKKKEENGTTYKPTWQMTQDRARRAYDQLDVSKTKFEENAYALPSKNGK